MIESGVTFDSAQFVMDNEIARMIKHVVGGVRVDDESLAVDDIDAVGAFGDFLSLDATMRHMRELSQPEFLDRRVREDWESSGAPTCTLAATPRRATSSPSTSRSRSPDDVAKRIRAIVEETDRAAGVTRRREPGGDRR